MNNRKYKVDETYFEKIDTEDKAYFLGLLYADGGVNLVKNNISYKFSIFLGEKDSYIINQFKYYLKSEHPICTKFAIKSTHQNQCGININSKKMCSDLIKLGCTPRKSFTLQFPIEDQVPNNLLPHFIRGVFDGDGGIQRTIKAPHIIGIKITGSYHLLDGINKYLYRTIGMNGIKISKNKNVFALKFTRNSYVRRFYNLIYKDAKFFLHRKKKSVGLSFDFDLYFRYKGYTKTNLKSKPWKSIIVINKKSIIIGMFATEKEARNAYVNYVNNNLIVRKID